MLHTILHFLLLEEVGSGLVFGFHLALKSILILFFNVVLDILFIFL